MTPTEQFEKIEHWLDIIEKDACSRVPGRLKGQAESVFASQRRAAVANAAVKTGINLVFECYADGTPFNTRLMSDLARTEPDAAQSVVANYAAATGCRMAPTAPSNEQVLLLIAAYRSYCDTAVMTALAEHLAGAKFAIPMPQNTDLVKFVREDQSADARVYFVPNRASHNVSAAGNLATLATGIQGLAKTAHDLQIPLENSEAPSASRTQDVRIHATGRHHE